MAVFKRSSVPAGNNSSGFFKEFLVIILNYFFAGKIFEANFIAEIVNCKCGKYWVLIRDEK
jgi:hypothetical protein